MKIKDAINMANLMENGNTMPKELAVLFLSELDGMIQSDIMLHAPEEIVSYTDEEQELLLRPPHDKLYVHYLVMMIRNQQQEYEGYQNSQAAVDEKLKTFRRWYVQHYRPADTASRSYIGGTSADAFGFAYLTAYGLAVKHGYSGTEEEWLESLHGEPGAPGEPARMRYDADREMVQWGVGEVWYDLFDLQTMRDPAVAAFLTEAEEYRDQAKAAAVAADEDAQAAQHYALNAGDSATNAGKSAAAAAGAAGAAEDAEANAAAYADDARTQAETAGNYAAQAEAAAKRAEDAQGGIAEETDPTVPAWAKAAQKPSYTAEEVGADPAGTATGAVNAHNVSMYAHNDLRLQLESLANRINAALDSTDTDLDQLAEIVAYIKSNKSLIDAITTTKVNVADIVNNLLTNVANRPLSAAMGVALASDIDSLRSALGGYQPKGDYALATAIPTKISQLTNDTDYLPRSELENAVEDALTEAEVSGKFDGADGRGIVSIARTDGNGAAGTVDTYTITYTDGTTSTYQVRNGSDGADGYTPVKGVDYYTEADRAELVSAVLARIEDGNGVAY